MATSISKTFCTAHRFNRMHVVCAKPQHPSVRQRAVRAALPRYAAPTAPQHAQHAQHTQRAQHAQRSRGGTIACASTAAPPSPADAATLDDERAAEGVDSAEAAPQVLAGKTVGVVGGGPGGMLCAAHLARLGASVDVFERFNPGAVDESKPPPALWSIGLATTATNAVRAAGLDPDFGSKWKCAHYRFEGSASLIPGKPPRYFGAWAKNKVAMASVTAAIPTQPGIVAHLAAECERVYGNVVTVTHGMRAVGGRVCEGEVVLEDAAGERTTRQFDLVVGADGSGSAVRGFMQEQDADLKVRFDESAMGIICTRVKSPGHPSTYATLPTPSGETFQSVPEGFDGPLDGCVVNFAQPAKVPGARTGLCFFAYRHNGEEVSFAMSGDAEWLKGRHSEADLIAAFTDTYPHLPRVWLEGVAAFLHSQAMEESLRIRVPSFVTCSKIASGRAVLIGDAAHSVSPNVGMGCNAALQDSEVLSRACVAAAGNVAAAARTYNAERLTNAHALTDISKQLDAAENFRYHRSVLAAVRGMPYLIPRSVIIAARQAPGKFPGFLKPNFSVEMSFHEWDDWTKIQRAAAAYSAKLLTLAAAAIAAVAGLGWGAFSVIKLAL